MRRLAFYAGAIAATAALLVWVFLPDPTPVETARVSIGDLTVRLEAEGEARIREVVVVSAPIAGQLQRVALHPGDPVTAGQTVAQIGPVSPALLDSRARAIAEATAAAAAAAVELARSQMSQAEATLDFARTEAERVRALFARGALSQRVLDDAILSERTATAAAASASANLAVREKEQQSAEAMLDGGAVSAVICCRDIKAPVAGRILRVMSENEQVVPAGAPILEIGDLNDLEISVNVLSRDAVAIRKGAAATITGWGGPDLAAEVERVEPSATTRVSALGIEEQRVDVLLALSAPPPPALGHGFRVTAEITVQEARGVLRVPIAALFRSGGNWAVYTVQDGKAVMQLITLGASTDEQAEVLSGLDDGATVILHPADTLQDGGRVAP